jgi:S-formylglutathione hydrolase FrmB
MKSTIFFIIIVLFSSPRPLAADVDTIKVFSKAMNKDVKTVIITPANYRKAQPARYPVVYLLHGYGGDYSQWIKIAPQLKDHADEYQMIIVCPDGGRGSWYIDSPVDTTFRYDTFISRELVDYIDTHYQTAAERQKRGITGLSMGGHGGLYLAINHIDVYGAAGSTSGGVDIRPFPNNWDLKKRLGDTTCCKANWEKYTVINQVNRLERGDLKIVIDCGLDDFFLEVNRNLHKKLIELKIAHDYIERPGAHNSAYWKNSIDYQMLFFHKAFRIDDN